jgi:hypothetical protein
MQVQTVAAVGDPPVQVKFGLEPVLSLMHPLANPSSHTSVPTTNPSLRIGVQGDPENPVEHEQTEAVEVLPEVHEYPTLTPVQVELHPPAPPSSQVSGECTREFPQ